MSHALSPSVRYDAELPAAEDTAIINLVQVLAINLGCFFAFTGIAMLVGLAWWVSVLIGWVGAGVATVSITALVIVLWPVAAQEATFPRDRPAVTAAAPAMTGIDMTAHLTMWHRDLEEELDGAVLAEMRREDAARTAASEVRSEGFFAMAREISAERRSA